MNRVLPASLLVACVAAHAQAVTATVLAFGVSSTQPYTSGPRQPQSGLIFDVGQTSGASSISGQVSVQSTYFNGVQTLSIGLSNVTIRSDAPGTSRFGIRVVADFALLPTTERLARVSQQFEGRTAFVSETQSARITNLSTHDTTTAFAALDSGLITGVGTTEFNANHGQVVFVRNTPVYRMDVSYTFDVTAAGAGFAEVNLAYPGRVATETATLVNLPTLQCDPIDFNRDGLFPDDSDLVDFLSVLAGGTCSTGTCNDIDFNNDRLFPDDADVIAFFRVLAGGTCQ